MRHTPGLRFLKEAFLDICLSYNPAEHGFSRFGVRFRGYCPQPRRCRNGCSARRADQFAALFHRPFYPHLFGFLVRFAFSYFQSQILGQVAMERFRHYAEL